MLIISLGRLYKVLVEEEVLFKPMAAFFCSSESWLIQCDNTTSGAVSFHDES